MARAGSILVLAAILIGAAAAPAAAAAPSTDSTIVTVVGHVRDESGKPVPGIVVAAGCGCDAWEPDAGSHDSDTSNRTGYFSLHVQRRFVRSASVSDPDQDYLPTASASLSLSKRSERTYVLNARVTKSATIAGTVRNDAGDRLRGVPVIAHDATTGKAVRLQSGGFTDKNGRYHLRLPAGKVTLRFGESPSPYIVPEWYGDSTTRASSPVVVARAGKKTAGVNASITEKPSVNGHLTIDGAEPLTNVDELAVLQLTRADGTVAAKAAGHDRFSIAGVAPGDYTLTARPTAGSPAFFAPTSIPVTVSAGRASRGLHLDVSTVNPPANAQWSSEVGVSVSTDEPKSGGMLVGTITVRSYGAVKGGVVRLSVDGERVLKTTVPASGIVKFRTRLGTVENAAVRITAVFEGSTKADKDIERFVWATPAP
jgi:hypothetical protein